MPHSSHMTSSGQARRRWVHSRRVLSRSCRSFNLDESRNALTSLLPFFNCTSDVHISATTDGWLCRGNFSAIIRVHSRDHESGARCIRRIIGKLRFPFCKVHFADFCLLELPHTLFSCGPGDTALFVQWVVDPHTETMKFDWHYKKSNVWVDSTSKVFPIYFPKYSS